MEVWKAAVLGLVQGITEFLPVSSSGHLLLFERMLGVETGGADMFLGIMLHAGTLIAVLFFYAPQLIGMLKGDRRQIGYLFLATIPAALVGVFLGDAVDRLFFGGRWLWLFFALTALLLFASERYSRRPHVFRPLGVKNAAAVGFAQALAVIPGLSRSGTTLAAGIFCGLERERAADFSFLLSIPVIAGALLVEGFKAFTGENYMAAISWQGLLAGTACAAVSGLAALWLLRKVVRWGKLYPFAIYLLALSAILAASQIFF